ncbi:glycosyltransferase 87 family protein [Streptomyces tanashiensis]|uniref:Glycosyltransferase 87 family protein n=1 Tax=Streptomyces tanashiensis TaxID=67367 RepID=A0ABY6R0X9_9ACTN|nr:glycosyltransferase 87 family protein [Streptomyces tanashiensis]UZX23698.1 glycosyltransferase 87 family protein [Streptomyces tanashiensis]
MTNDHPQSPPHPGGEPGGEPSARPGSLHEGEPSARPGSLHGNAPSAPARSRSEPSALTGSPFDSDTFTSATFVTVERGPHLALAAVWLLTRAGMLLLLARDDLGIGGVGREVALYQYWYGKFADGTFPPDDATWQYPPGAGLVIMSPGALPWLSYFQAFVALTLLADAVVTLALARADSARLTHGTWIWVCGLPLLLHLPLARYDVQTTALAVLALLAVGARSTAAHQLGGALAGIGAMVKVWPALALIGTPRGRTTREAWTAAVVTALALLATLALFFSDSLGFLRQQGSRGIQIESLGGTALAVARATGVWPGRVEFRYGAFEYVGPYVSSLGHLALLLTVIAFGWLLLWRLTAHRWTPATPLDAALAAVLLFTVTSRVISPQYMIWLLGLAAACLTSRSTVMRPVALLLLPAAALSSLAYPVLYDEVVAGTTTGLAVMVLRNGLLLAAALLAARRLWTSTTGGPPAT